MAGNKAKISSKSKSHPEAGQGGFGRFVYNSEKGTFFGRTCGSWVKIIVFYLIFYACLAGFFSLNFYIFSRTLNEDSPKWTLSESLIGSNPGIGFRPMPDQDKNAESTLIWYRSDSESDSAFWYKQLEEVVNKSQVPPGTHGVVDCNYHNVSATAKVSCRVDVTKLGPCNIANNFGYRYANPCVLVKLNKIYDWKPEPYGVDEDGKYDATLLTTELDEKVAEGLPVDLKTFILNEVRKNPGDEVNVLRTVWISCGGENVGDQENLPPGYIQYYPTRGIPGYYFPYLNQKNYKSPFVFVHINLPQSSLHTLVNIECRAWAKNIKYDRIFRQGSVHFEVMVDSDVVKDRERANAPFPGEDSPVTKNLPIATDLPNY